MIEIPGTYNTTEQPRIYVACLAAYSAGHLHGEWITFRADSTAEEVRSQIDQMLNRSPIAHAEDWAIHAHEGWSGISIGEHEPLERLIVWFEMLQQHGEAFAAYCHYYGSDATAGGFLDRYVGKYDSEEAYAEELWEQQGRLAELERLKIQPSYIDWSAVATDLFINAYRAVSLPDSAIVYVFVR